jgi:hypothetical protein
MCKKCRNIKYWEGIREARVRHLLKEKRDGKRITIRLTKRIESKLSGNVSQLVLSLLANEAAKGMSIYDDEELNEHTKL